MIDPVPARTLASAEDLDTTVRKLAGQLSDDYPEGVLLVAVLKGGVWFLADLVRALSVPCEVDFLAISAYAEGTGRVRVVKDLDADIYGRDVVLVEDVIDTGLTLTYLLGELSRREPRSLEVCALVDKPARRLVPAPVRYIGLAVADDFVLGYGLDFAERYRNLRELVAGDLDQLSRDPDAYVEQLYRG